MTLMDAQAAAEDEANRHAENAARLAQVYATFDSKGQGSIEHDQAIVFELTFIERPTVAYGTYCDMNALDDLLALDPEVSEVTPLPVCTGYVTEWDQDERGFYLGCWIGARVYYPESDLVPIEAQPAIQHHFTFSGVAMKDVPPDVTD
jgi:hypothetical protein